MLGSAPKVFRSARSSSINLRSYPTLPGPLDTAILSTPEANPTFERCKHNRPLRLNFSAGQSAKKMSHEYCRRQCGRSTEKLHTLWPPAPSVPSTSASGANVHATNNEDDSGVTLTFVLGGLNILWGAIHTFCPILGADLGLLLIEIQNIGGAKAP